jgi:uncharacterized protein YjbJ (UPF0337 family)
MEGAQEADVFSSDVKVSLLKTREISKFQGGTVMNWDQVEGKWKQYKGKVKEKWGKLTDDDLDVIDGKRQQLVGKLQEHYGLAKDAAEKQADEFVSNLHAEDREAARQEGREEGREQERARRAGQR